MKLGKLMVALGELRDRGVRSLKAKGPVLLEELGLEELEVDLLPKERPLPNLEGDAEAVISAALADGADPDQLSQVLKKQMEEDLYGSS